MLLTFSQLSRAFCLLGWIFFLYIQLRHPARAQFPTQPLLQLDPFEELLSQEDLEKPFSALYGALLIIDAPKIERLWDLWKQDIPSLDKEDWEDCLNQCPKLVISSRDKLMQTTFSTLSILSEVAQNVPKYRP